MSHSSPYLIPVFDLVHRPGEMREHSLEIAVPEGFGIAVIAVRDDAALAVEVRLESLHDGILVSGTAKTIADGECVRCLTEVRLPVKVEFQELFAYSFDEAFDYMVDDNFVDLQPVIRDAVVLSLPFQPVCQEDCPGLCVQCGVRLLDNPGHEHELPIDARWAALAGLEGLVAGDDVTGAAKGTTEEKR